jgi:hypothetical protein
MKFNEIIQKTLPFGYLFLVVLGILKESVFYYQVGINILKYSNIMDILISPIADLTSTPIILLGFVLFIFFLYLMSFLVSKNYNKEWIKKRISSTKTLSDITEDDVKAYFGKYFIVMFAVGLLSFFLGIGIGKGSKVANKISNNELKYDYAMTFGNDETKEIYLIGSNSSNYFYVEKGSENVKISPTGAIKSIEITNNQRLKK